MNEDWAAIMSSDVFTEYLRNELKKEASQTKEKDPNLNSVLDSFADFEKKVNENPRLKRAFAKWQDVFSNDMMYRDRVDQNFVDAVMMLNIKNDESQE